MVVKKIAKTRENKVGKVFLCGEYRDIEFDMRRMLELEDEGITINNMMEKYEANPLRTLIDLAYVGTGKVLSKDKITDTAKAGDLILPVIGAFNKGSQSFVEDDVKKKS